MTHDKYMFQQSMAIEKMKQEANRQREKWISELLIDGSSEAFDLIDKIMENMEQV